MSSLLVHLALGVDAERWNDIFLDVREWRMERRDRYGISTKQELHVCDPVLDLGYETWEDSERAKDIPIEKVIRGRAFRSSCDDRLLRMADLIAHMLLEQEEPAPRACPVFDTSAKILGIARAFPILEGALIRKASSGGEGREAGCPSRITMHNLWQRVGFLTTIEY